MARKRKKTKAPPDPHQTRKIFPKLQDCEQPAPTLRGEHGVVLALKGGGVRVFRLDGCFETPHPSGSQKQCDGLILGVLGTQPYTIFVELTSGEGKGVEQIVHTVRRMCKYADTGHPWGEEGMDGHRILGVVVGGSRAQIPRAPKKIHGKSVSFRHFKPSRGKPIAFRDFLEKIAGT